MKHHLSGNILDTIIYYDLLDFPLTAFEIWKYLLRIAAPGEPRLRRETGDLRLENDNEENLKYSLADAIEVLDGRELKNNVEEFRGFYFLKGRKVLVERRIQCDKYAVEKYKIAERVTKRLKYVPFVRMAALTGTLAMKNCEKDSDIDFFVVLEKGRIFTGRLLVTALVHLLGRRRYNKKIKNRICLNYFITTVSLEIQRQDLFAANEYTFIYPLFGFETHQRFGEANIDWIKKFKPNFKFSDLKPAKYFVETSPFQQRVQKRFENLINLFGGDRIEAWLKGLQIKRIERKSRMLGEDAYIAATDAHLIFLPEPQGRKIEEQFKILTNKNNFL